MIYAALSVIVAIWITSIVGMIRAEDNDWLMGWSATAITASFVLIIAVLMIFGLGSG